MIVPTPNAHHNVTSYWTPLISSHAVPHFMDACCCWVLRCWLPQPFTLAVWAWIAPVNICLASSLFLSNAAMHCCMSKHCLLSNAFAYEHTVCTDNTVKFYWLAVILECKAWQPDTTLSRQIMHVLLQGFDSPPLVLTIPKQCAISAGHWSSYWPLSPLISHVTSRPMSGDNN